MEVIEGRAERLRLSTETSGDTESVSTTHVATLQLGKVPVRLQMPSAIMIGDGDKLMVAGLRGSDGVFAGLAYRNVDTGARGKSSGTMEMILGTVFLCLGIGAGLAVLVVLSGAYNTDAAFRFEGAAFASIFMLAFGGFGLRAIQQFNRSSAAVAALS